MSDEGESARTTRWYKASELPLEVFDVWHKPNCALNPVAIVATVDADGAPRAAPYGSLRALTPCLLRFSPSHYHSTYANLCRDGRAAVTMISAPNIAVSVCGHARVVRERMLTDEDRAIVEIDIQEVRNNMVSTLVIENGITISAREEFVDWYQMVIGELAEIS